MKKVLLFAIAAILSIGCNNTNTQNINAMQNQIDSLSYELNRYKEKYGEFPVLNQNSNLFGMWEICYYVDEFGEKTNSRYIANKDIIVGRFENSATTNSDLGVLFIINNENNVNIKLFEYLRNHPVKDGGSYNILIQDESGERYNLRGSNYSSDKLRLNHDLIRTDGTVAYKEDDSRILFNLLSKGGKLQFKITNNKYTTSVYRFEILNADYFKEAFDFLNNN